MSLILYTTVGVSDLPRAIAFYDAVFGALGCRRSHEGSDGWAGWGPSYDEGVSFWICRPFDGRSPRPGNGAMIALRARGEAEVVAFYEAALAHGGTDEGAPGTRPYYEPSFYVAYVRDPDGNKLACVFHQHQPDE
ncbi:VOC family protein [Hypericibacter sp.]|uniref:VOC family protein n=1 Tax=Hypericibacter sp. TaxID=2705401 RepID=UPI003D6D23F7